MTQRTLHVIDADAGWWSLHAVGVLRRSSPNNHAALLIAGSSIDELANSVGLSSYSRISAPRCPVRNAASALHRFVNHSGSFDEIHAWSAWTARVTHAAFPTRQRTATLTLGPSRLPALEARALRRVFAETRMTFSSQTVRGEWSTALEQTINAQIVPLPIESTYADRVSVRQGWGMSQDVCAIGGLGSPMSNIDAKALAYQAGVMSFAGASAAAVVPAGARDLERAARFIERHEPRWGLVIEPRPIWDWLCACDVVLWQGDRWRDTNLPSRRPPTGTHSLAWAAAIGVPIIAEDRPAARESVGDNGALFVPPRDALAMNRAVLRVLEDSDATQSRINAARAHVTDRNASSRFVSAFASQDELVATT